MEHRRAEALLALRREPTPGGSPRMMYADLPGEKSLFVKILTDIVTLWARAWPGRRTDLKP
jgi:hypothetical protein